MARHIGLAEECINWERKNSVWQKFQSPPILLHYKYLCNNSLAIGYWAKLSCLRSDNCMGVCFEKGPAFTDANWIKPTLISDLSRAFYVSWYEKKQIVTASNEQSATQRFWHNARHEVYYRLQKSLGIVTQKNQLMPLPIPSDFGAKISRKY